MDGPGTSDHTLLTEPVLVVRQEWRDGRLPEYHVFDRQSDLVAKGRYLPDDELEALLRGLGLRHRTAAALRVVDTGGSVVVTVVFPGFRARSVMLVQDGRGDDVGAAVKVGGVLRPRFELRHAGARVGAVQVVDRRQREVRVLDDGGTEVARVRTIQRGGPFHVPGDADGCWLEVERQVDEPLRTLLVATSVALQAAIGSESRSAEVDLLTLPLLPARFDPLRRRL